MRKPNPTKNNMIVSASHKFHLLEIHLIKLLVHSYKNGKIHFKKFFKISSFFSDLQAKELIFKSILFLAQSATNSIKFDCKTWK